MRVKLTIIQLILVVVSKLSYATKTEDNGEAKKIVQIPKLCSLGYVLTLNLLSNWECMKVVKGSRWTGFLYDEKTLKRTDPGTYQAKYAFNTGKEQCKDNKWTILLNGNSPVSEPSRIKATENMEFHNNSLSPSSKSNEEILFILLTNGELMWASNLCTCGKCERWIPLRAKFFLDGLGTPIGNGTASYSGKEADQILYVCQDQNDEITQYNLRNDKGFVAVLFTTAFIYLITVIIYVMLWSNHSLPGRVLLSVVLSRTVMSFMLGLAYTGKLYRWDKFLPSWCFLIAILTHYFTISAYSWVTVLNFDLWWTFRNLRPSSDPESLNKKYFMYSCFGWVMPFLLVGSSWIVDMVYRGTRNIDYKFIPNYGNGVCFLVDCAYGIYVHTFTLMFLVPALVFSILTFNALCKFKKETIAISDAKHGEKHSSFQLYLKLLVIMSISWTIGEFVWFFHAENDGSKGFYVRNTILLVLHWGVDLIGTSVFILVVFGCSQANLSKMEQRYETFHAIFERFRQYKKAGSTNASEHEHCLNSSTPLLQMQTQSTTAEVG